MTDNINEVVKNVSMAVKGICDEWSMESKRKLMRTNYSKLIEADNKFLKDLRVILWF